MEKGDEVANLIDPLPVGKKDRAPAAIPREHWIEPRKRSRYFSVGIPTPQTGLHLVARKKCLRLGLLTPPTDRHHTVREKRGWTRSLRRATRGQCILNAARRVPGGSARNAVSRAMVDGGSVWRACTPNAELMPRPRGTTLEARFPFAGTPP